MPFTVTTYTTTFTENEVFGTSCGDCGWASFDAGTPNRCAECGSDNLGSADGCEIPHDSAHVSEEVETFLVAGDVADYLERAGLTEYDGGTTFRNPDGSVISDYGTGEREEVTAHVSGPYDGPLVALACGNIDARLRERRHMQLVDAGRRRAISEVDAILDTRERGELERVALAAYDASPGNAYHASYRAAQAWLEAH